MAHNADKTLTQFLVTIAFVAAMAFFNWMKRRGQSEVPPETQSEPEPSFPPRSRPSPLDSPARPSPAKIDWESELRRMLEGHAPHPPPRQAPEPRPFQAPPILSPVPQLETVRPSLARSFPVQEQDQGLPVELPGLTGWAQSYNRASRLDENMAAHLQQIRQQISHHAPLARVAGPGPEVTRALALLQDPQSIRSAFIVSVILAPPQGW